MQTAARATKEKQELVRILTLEHGMQKAAELADVPYELVRQWESRRKRRAIKQAQSAGVTLSQSVVQPVAQRIESDLAEHEKETRLSLAKSARQMAKDCETLPVRHADKALKVGQLAGIVHKWNDGSKGESFSLNVLNMGALEVRVGKEHANPDPTISE